jgi:hypothetical protein
MVHSIIFYIFDPFHNLLSFLKNFSLKANGISGNKGVIYGRYFNMLDIINQTKTRFFEKNFLSLINYVKKLKYQT